MHQVSLLDLQGSRSIFAPSTRSKKPSIPELVVTGILCGLAAGCVTSVQQTVSGNVTETAEFQAPGSRLVTSPPRRARARRTSFALADAPLALRARLAEGERSVGFSAVAVSICRPGAGFRYEGRWRQSYHATCEAIDFKVVPASKKPAALAWFQHNHSGHVINYPNGQCPHCTHIHIDTGSRAMVEDTRPRFPIARVDP